ncbi:hypothetical protein [Saccharopolyspora elongata]|uniref:Uncharacterized protein n=1 Tax=Saccharopolyspora elongata TaxID=2530387 RepID=A0A4R4ZEA3_9PSEU|nr:hypothetical protein [Saccharopolyspora elongata]TDD55629.1 hypothetical protein E1288_04105 [Saccharopolyspora elongata]
MSGFTADPATLEQIANVLRTSADALDTAGAVPPVPQAGDCSEAVCAAMALLCQSALGAVRGLVAAGEQVAHSGVEYVGIDQGQFVDERP